MVNLNCDQEQDIRSVMQWAVRELKASKICSARGEAEILLSSLLDCQFADLYLAAATQFERFSLDYANKTEDREEGLRSFLEKREADFQGR